MPDEEKRDRITDRVLRGAEDGVYALVSFVLLAAALALLVATTWSLATSLGHGAADAVKEALDGLLLIFILVELLSAVRATVTQHKLVAEPFLLVGMIASIKEIVVLTIGARDDIGTPGDRFTDALSAIGVLAGLLLVLTVATLLVRRKEREPTE